MNVPRGRNLKRSRAMSRSESAAIIQRAVKRAKSTPTYRSKFRLYKNNNLSLFPKQMRQTLTYSEATVVNLLATVGTIGSFRIRANSLFDPRVALGGHQPMGFDQLMAIYSKFCVVGAKITAYVGPAGASTFLYGSMGINVVDPASTLVTNITDAIESQFSTWKNFNVSITNKMQLGFDSSRYFGIKDIQDDDTLTGTAVADCTKQAYFDIWVASDTGVAGQNVTVTFNVEYDALFFEPRNVPAS